MRMMNNKLREAAAESPASASRISFSLYRPSIRGRLFSSSSTGGLPELDDGAVEQVLQGLCGGAGRYPLQMGAGEGQGRQACHRQKNGTAQGEGERQAHDAGQKPVYRNRPLRHGQAACTHCG